MCGLAGILTSGALPVSQTRNIASAMTDVLQHRGPDDDGVWAGEGIVLGHRRLSVLELSPAGAQPMHSSCGRYVIAFNGEIYNHLDLRNGLAAAGATAQWRGHSDTETLLAAIVHWGLDEALNRAYGMFALALWDQKLRRLSLARDRIGEKPLYWGWAGNNLVFGSELKALRRHPEFCATVCRGALAQYFRFTYVPAPRSIYVGVYKLEPGTILEVEGAPPPVPPREPLRPEETYGSLSVRRYWSLQSMVELGTQSRFNDDADALGALKTALHQAVGRQMVADVPLGAFLSGGIDSSLIVALMQQQSSQPVRTFTVGFENPRFNEAPHAAAVARHLGTDHTELIVTESDARAVIPLLPDLYDEPFADSSQIPTYLVCRSARSQVTVALSGDGGDELFGGYKRYFWAPRLWQRLSWLPFPLRRLLGRMVALPSVDAWNQIGTLIGGSGGSLRMGDRMHRLAQRLAEVRDLEDLYRSMISEWHGANLVAGLATEPPSQLDDPLPLAMQKEPVARMMFQDMRSYLPDDILCKVDRAAMGVSLETRVPFLDPEVLALSARLPMHMKIRGGKGKWALRQLLYRHVPQELIDRPKAGFGIPVGDWLRGPLKSWAQELLSPEALKSTGLLEPAPIQRAWIEHQLGVRDWTPRLWTVLMFQAWSNRT